MRPAGRSSAAGEDAGKGGKDLDRKHEHETEAENVYKHLVAEKPFDVIRGEHSSIVPGLLSQNLDKGGGSQPRSGLPVRPGTLS